MNHGLRISLSAADSAEASDHAWPPDDSSSPQLVGERTANGLAQLVLILIKLLHELLERQALRRMETDELSEERIEQLGQTLMQQAREIDRLRELLNLRPEDLNLDLGPLGHLFDE
ncbi:gas vesicle protein K [Methylohalobius crimeensis]|uniref:gas vesicle protein K n=1 Tax=Methylohalobius crimeensis TaxID=244365 RepID=UPI0003B3503B|nr:gas vesicle protein K [Methylohalobius crimeensis]